MVPSRCSSCILHLFHQQTTTGKEKTTTGKEQTTAGEEQTTPGKEQTRQEKEQTTQEKERFDAALRRRQLSLIIAGKMKPEEATELKKLFS